MFYFYQNPDLSSFIQCINEIFSSLFAINMVASIVRSNVRNTRGCLNVYDARGRNQKLFTKGFFQTAAKGRAFTRPLAHLLGFGVTGNVTPPSIISANSHVLATPSHIQSQPRSIQHLNVRMGGWEMWLLENASRFVVWVVASFWFNVFSLFVNVFCRFAIFLLEMSIFVIDWLPKFIE